MRPYLLSLLLVTLVCLAAATDKMKVSTRHEEVLEHELAERASLFFRAIDFDHDKKIGEEDVKRNQELIQEQMPGITIPQLIEFISAADRDNDKKLNRDEFMNGLAQGFEPPKQQQQQPQLLETEATVSREKKAGFLGPLGAIANNVIGKVKGAFNRLLGLVDKSQDACVMCQYIVERVEANVKASGVVPGLGAPGPQTVYDDSFLEVEDNVIPAIALLEVGAEQEQERGVGQHVGSSIISSTRQSTRYQRQLERQKYNEIYRVTDVTLDDVCEQGMPNAYYGYCKSVYKRQQDVVDGLRYQYRPTDICYRIGMCGKRSYITKGIHSRYRKDN